MCGIAGIISLDGSNVNDGSIRVKKMLSNMSYRGPDGSGIYVDDNKKVILGNNRLAITDPSYKFNGPLALENNNLVMSFNGEIYDYMEKKTYLENKGISIRSKTDTEVLMQGIKNKGINFLNEVDGCWAFAFLNKYDNQLIISRDLLGEKQIFFFKNNKEFIFSSEVYSLLSILDKRIKINVSELISSFRFFSSSAENTLVSSVKKFKPGQTLIFDLSTNNTKETYPVKLKPSKWSEFFSSNPSDESVIKKLSELLFISVKNRLAKDVPFFTTLSGGIDSSLMTYFASLEKKNIDTIFIETSKNYSLDSDELTEIEASKFTSKLLKTNHKIIYSGQENNENKLKDNAIRSTDGLLDWGTISFELIGQAVKKQGYKSILVSEGADELCGYNIDRNTFYIYENLKNKTKTKEAILLLNKNNFFRKVLRRIKLTNNIFIEPYCSLNPLVFKPHHEAMGHDFLSKYFQRNIINITHDTYGVMNSEYKDFTDKLDFSQQFALSYMNFSIPNYSNLRIDKGFMKASVEPRCPFLNLEVVNFLLGMPANYKFRQGYSKYILRKMVEKFIGKEIAWRKKHGFSHAIWKQNNIKENLKIKDNILKADFMNKLPWSRNGKNYLKKNIYSKLSWPLYTLSQMEKEYDLDYKIN